MNNIIQQDAATGLYYFMQGGVRSVALYETHARAYEEYMEKLLDELMSLSKTLEETYMESSSANVLQEGILQFTPIKDIVDTVQLDDLEIGETYTIRVVSKSGRVFYGDLKEHAE